MAVFCSFSADSSEQVLATTESDMPADSEPLLVEVTIITIMILIMITMMMTTIKFMIMTDTSWIQHTCGSNKM